MRDAGGIRHDRGERRPHDHQERALESRSPERDTRIDEQRGEPPEYEQRDEHAVGLELERQVGGERVPPDRDEHDDQDQRRDQPWPADQHRADKRRNRRHDDQSTGQTDRTARQDGEGEKRERREDDRRRNGGRRLRRTRGQRHRSRRYVVARSRGRRRVPRRRASGSSSRRRGLAFSRMKASPIVANITARKTTIGIVLGRARKTLAP